MSQFLVEKHRASAELMLSNGESRRGCFFLGGSAASRLGPERVKDVLNAEPGFVPFETTDPVGTILLNRTHLVMVHLLGSPGEAEADPGYDVATVRHVMLRLTNRTVLRGFVRVVCPPGRDRLSDYAHTGEWFRYLENADGTYIVNSAHIVEMSEVPS